MEPVFTFSKVSRLALGRTQPHIEWVPRAPSPVVKQLRREVDHSPPSSGDVENGEAIPPLPNFALFFLDVIWALCSFMLNFLLSLICLFGFVAQHFHDLVIIHRDKIILYVRCYFWLFFNLIYLVLCLKRSVIFVRLEVLTTVTMYITVFLGVTTCRLVDIYQRFCRTCCLVFFRL
jgi:hypothetical protein